MPRRVSHPIDVPVFTGISQWVNGWATRPPSARAQEHARLLRRMRALHTEHDGVIGSPRMWEELRYAGERCGRHRVARVMRRAGLQGVPQRRRWRTKPSGIPPAGTRNLVERDFTATAPNTKWVTDITYIPTAEHWLYLCIVVDLYSDVVVGWSMSSRQDRHVVLQAVLMAVWQRPGKTPVILHSDRGCQFTSDEYQQFLAAHHITCSMSAVGSCADNAAAESFFGLLKRERVNRRQYRTRAEARADLFDYIERWHNPPPASETGDSAAGGETLNSTVRENRVEPREMPHEHSQGQRERCI